MCVDVIQFRRIQFSFGQSRTHRAFAAIAILGWCCDVIGVTRQAIAQNFGINFCAACFRVFVFFQHNDARTLTHDKTITIRIIGARCSLWIIRTLCRERLARIKARNSDFANCCLCPARDHHIGIIGHDQTCRVANGMRTCGTCGHNRVVWPLEPIANADMSRNEVDQSPGNKEWRNAACAFFFDHNSGVGNGLQATDP